MLTKKCPKCKEEKNLDEFHKDKTTKDGLRYLCKKCAYQNTKKNTREHYLNNKCKNCKSERLPTSKFCLYHFVCQLIDQWKISREEKLDLVPKLIEKLERSEYSCFYTGLKIIPGLTASIDHRKPKSKGGTHNIENLEWIHVGLNNVKSKNSEGKFLKNSAAILVELNALASKEVIL